MASRPDQMEARDNREGVVFIDDPKAINNARKKYALDIKKERQAIFELMQHPVGRTFMWNSVRCIVESSPVVPGDYTSTYYNLGMEARARTLFKELVKIAPRQFVLMMKENAGEEYDSRYAGKEESEEGSSERGDDAGS